MRCPGMPRARGAVAPRNACAPRCGPFPKEQGSGAAYALHRARPWPRPVVSLPTGTLPAH
eukprot:4006910-Pyramimonas_sp.AAC.1